MFDSFPLVITLEKNALVTSKVTDLTKLFISFYSLYSYWPIFGQWNHSTFLLLKCLWCLVFWNSKIFQDHVLCLPQTCKQTSRSSGPFYWEMKRPTFWCNVNEAPRRCTFGQWAAFAEWYSRKGPSASSYLQMSKHGTRHHQSYKAGSGGQGSGRPSSGCDLWQVRPSPWHPFQPDILRLQVRD